VSGLFCAVVGPSGAGKDTLIDFARAALTDDGRYVFARRVITRPADAGGEDHIAASEADFARMKADGAFALSWHANGLDYGLPASLADDIADGRTVVANISRAALKEACARFAEVRALHVTASPAILAERLAARHRETADEIAARLKRYGEEITGACPVVTIVNDGTVEEAGEAFVAALRRMSAEAGSA